jgi:uncharacterized protein (TIGR02099 family)
MRWKLLKRLSLGLFVVVVVTLAIIMGGLRLAINNIDYFKPEIEYLLTQNVSKGIVFAGVSGALNRFNPILRIENVSINLPDRSQPLFVDRLAVEFDFWASLRERAPVVLEITGKLEKLELTRDASDRWWTHEFEIPLGDTEAVLPGFARVLALVPRYLKLDLRRLIFHDQKTQSTYQFNDVAAQINHRKNQFHTQLSAVLPDDLGRGILIKSVIDPDRSVIYINSSDLQLSRIAGLLDLDVWGLQTGTLDGEVWLSMSGYDVMSVDGNLVLKQGLLQSSPEKTPVAVDYHSRFNAINRNSGWRIVNQVERLKINEINVPGFRTQFEVTAGPDKTLVAAWIDRLRIASLPVVAGQWLPPRFNQQIANGKFQGALRDVMLGIDLERPEDFRISGHAVEISSEAFASYPGATNLNADFLLGGNRLRVKLYGESVRLDFGDRFRAPFEFDAFELDAVVNRSEAGDLVFSADNILARNNDISATGRMWLIADQAEEPFAFMRASFTDTHVSSTRNYLPIKLLPPDTLEWLDDGLKKGFVPRGDFQFHGRLRDIRELAKERSGELFVDFDVENTNLFFAPGWLPLRNGNGRILFHNAGFNFVLDRASYEKLDNVRASGAIADFDKAELTLDINAQAATADTVRVWLGTPVGEEYRDIFSNLHDLDGKASVKIDLRLPLRDGLREQQVKVAIDFDDARAKADIWGLELAGINGLLLVTEDTIQARDISAKYFSDPVKIDISTDMPGGDIRVDAHGVVESRNLLRKLPDQLTRYVNGKSDWQVGLIFTSETAPVERAFLQVSATSNLQATKITLPPPLAKPSKDTTRLAADLAFYPDRIDFHFNLDSHLRARGQLLAEDDKDFELNSIDLAFARSLKAEQQKGMHLYGSVNEVAVDDWIEVIDNYDSGGPTLLRTVDLDVKQAHAFGRTLERVEFDLYRENKRFMGLIISSLTRGDFEVPLQPSPEDPVIIQLEYLRLDKLEQERDYGGMSPTDLFDFRLRSEALVYNDMLFNDLYVDGRPVGNTLYIDNFGLRRDKIIITGEAHWDYDVSDRSHLSSLTLVASGEEFGQAIAGIGFGDTMQGGTLIFGGGFTWEAPLLGFALGILHGDASMKIEDGVLNNVEPGGGRFVGLLSLSAIPRRLTLDFADVLVEGMEFETITGSYRLEDGILYTKNSRMEGPAAKIKVSGKTDIVGREYDQVIRITPKLGQTLPLIGAVAASTTVGWGLLLLQSLFNKSIDDAVEIEYKVTGSWDDPQIELIRAVDENQEDLPNMEK